MEWEPTWYIIHCVKKTLFLFLYITRNYGLWTFTELQVGDNYFANKRLHGMTPLYLHARVPFSLTVIN